MSCYRGFDIPLGEPDQFSFLHFVTGSLPAQNFEGLRNELGDNVALFPWLEGRPAVARGHHHPSRPACWRSAATGGFPERVPPRGQARPWTPCRKRKSGNRNRRRRNCSNRRTSCKSSRRIRAAPGRDRGAGVIEWRLLEAGSSFRARIPRS